MTTDAAVAVFDDVKPGAPPVVHRPLSPGRQVWRRFRRERLGFGSLVVFVSLYLMSLAGEVLFNNRPLFVRYQGTFYFPLFADYREEVFGGDLPIFADYNDPFIRQRLSQGDNF